MESGTNESLCEPKDTMKRPDWMDGWAWWIDLQLNLCKELPASVQRVQLLWGSEEIKDILSALTGAAFSWKLIQCTCDWCLCFSWGINVYFKYTCVTGGAAMSSLISTLLTGVVTKAALSSHGITAFLTAGVTASFIKEPAGGTKLGPATVYNIHIYSVTSCCTCMTSWPV